VGEDGDPRIHRLFFALWPAAPAAAVLAAHGEAIVAAHGGRAMGAAKIHLTLAFLGDVSEDRIPAALEAARVEPFEPFTLRLDRLGGFRRSKVGWAGMSRPPAQLLRVQEALEGALRERQFALEARAFAPHVTLARKVERPVTAMAIEPVEWESRAVALVRTEPGSGDYVTIATVASAEKRG
jgi:2'-5' RNA ligase